jgi:quinol-cytochrome oxidoreductase complex cytochrome b subunit
MEIEIKSYNQRVSELLAITAMTLLLIHIIDGSIERIYKRGFLPASVDKRPFGISNLGISSIFLFFLAFATETQKRKIAKVTTTLLIVGGALIGTSVLGVSIMDKWGLVPRLLILCMIGYVIMGLGILKVCQKQQYKKSSSLPSLGISSI